ncbi:hypothetical protein M0R88_03325 [Halorussus gelatinilyticus]|uniref:DUF8135 domain-containing protein n=1 Tax=Halorussus gelatinilyticus TaxID=2937524 RepID=A0A8U0IKI7_9EURY|nr:hypothetical protein [Halorussus gelatinilyticus]UPW01141.1 hypothetical protein M0R88_03325 [Halorussus gelatinilyticus]
MSDERDERSDSERDGQRDSKPDDGERPTRRDGDPDEPLADLAAEVRERTGERRDGERRHGRGERHGERDERRDERTDRSEREGPLADVAAAVDERRTRKRDDADAFESVEVGEVDGERLWEQLAAGETDGTAGVPTEQSGDAAVPTGESDAADWSSEADSAGSSGAGSTTDATADWVADATDRAAGRDVRTIPKTTCHGCPHFGDPPELHCTHESTDILAMVDSERFRVADCPIVVDGEEDIGSIAVEGGDAGGGGDVSDGEGDE